jgi:hypothetical protein
MRGFASRSFLAVLAVLAVPEVHAARSPRCTVEVLQADALPYAPYGSWLTTAALVLRPLDSPPFIASKREKLPWQMSLRRGNQFQIPCEAASSGGFSLRDLAAAPSFRTPGTHSAFLRIR